MRFLIAIGLALWCTGVFSQPVFQEVSLQVGINHSAVMCDFEMPAQGGAAWFDYDNDGNYDLYLTGGAGPDALFRNNGNGTFEDVTVQAGLSVIGNVNTDGVTTGDINNDGFPEIFVSTFRTDVNRLFWNNGDGTFQEISDWEGSSDTANSFSASFADLNLDGFLDLYVSNWSKYQDVIIDGSNIYVDSQENYYYQNNGDGTFMEKAADLGIDDTLGCGLGVLITDFDNDHDLDVYVANDFGYFPGNSANRLFRNEYPNQMFTEISSDANLNLEMNGMGVAKTDINNDGQFDYYITNLKNDRFMVSSPAGYSNELIDRGLRNDSVWTQDLQYRRVKTGWGVAFLDIDNDMDEDLIVANGDLYYDYPNPTLDSNKCFLNNGFGQFEDISRDLGIADTYVSRALAYCDYDSDGDLDMFVGITDSVNGVSHSFLYRNDSPQMNWLQVKPIGIQNNFDGIGAKVIIYINGVRQMREVGGESSFNSQHWRVAHFGLGSHAGVDSLDVVWPGGGLDRYYSLQAGQQVEAVEGMGMITHVLEQQTFSVYPNPFSDHIIFEKPIDITKVELVDAAGRIVWSGTRSTANRIDISTSHLPKGCYTLRVETEQGALSKELVKF
ncbi:MAG: VCBS repeat-containing protein [Flavobacteriales bacterium]|nr:VCBS repeat-containing protein [Flavobacteriales bacterium]